MVTGLLAHLLQAPWLWFVSLQSSGICTAGQTYTMAVVLSENAIFGCCASQRFASRLAASNPFPSISALVDEARRIWWHECGVLDWLQAFDAHPKIGEKKASSPDSTFAKFSSAEQSAAAQSTTADISAELAHWNKLYADKFGFIFIICARGRSAPEILVVLKERFNRLPHEELHAASGEQMKITEMRLQALCGDAPSSDAASRAQARAEKVRANTVHKGSHMCYARAPV